MEWSAINRGATRIAARLAPGLVLAGALLASQLAPTPAFAASRPNLSRGHRACANANLLPTSANIAQIETATLCLINQQRALHRERALRNNASLDRAATGHSQNMVAADYFDHTSPTGSTVLRRIRASGYLLRGYGFELGENIDLGTLWLATPASAVAAWMNSPDHRANVLNADFVDSGIAVIAQAPAQYGGSEAGATYTQDFGAVEAPNGAVS